MISRYAIQGMLLIRTNRRYKRSRTIVPEKKKEVALVQLAQSGRKKLP